MKTTLWLTTFAMFAASPLAFSENDPSTLRTMVTERDRQIRQLEEENMKLRSLNGENVKPPAPKSVSATPVKNDAAATAAPVAQASSGGSSAVYTVKSGDTLAKIGRKVNSSPEALARLNGIKDPTKLRIGQKIKLPGTNAATRTAAAAPASPKAPIPSNSGDTYVVRDGDTFYSIARKFKLSADSLIAANPDIKPAAMRTGQLVRLHGKSSSAAVAQESRKPAEKPAEAPKPVAESRHTEEKPAEAAPKKPVSDTRTVANHPASPAQQQAPSPAKAPESPANAKSGAAKESVKSVIVDGETTYGEFAAKHGMQIDKLNELNGLALSQTTVLAKGSELYVNAQP